MSLLVEIREEELKRNNPNCERTSRLTLTNERKLKKVKGRNIA